VIYHYSNGEDKVVTDKPDVFERRFKARHSGSSVTLSCGKFPL
jgi:hypothetical protein